MFPFNWAAEPSIPANDLNIFTDLVLDCLELCKYTSLAKEIHGQCQMDNYEFTAEVFSVLFTLCILLPLVSPALFNQKANNTRKIHKAKFPRICVFFSLKNKLI